MSITGKTPSPWQQYLAQGPSLQPQIDSVKEIRDEMLMIYGEVQRKLRRSSDLERATDLFPKAFSLIEHIQQDLEDIQSGKSFRHG